MYSKGISPYDSNLNTSHVNVNRYPYIAIVAAQDYLNTSHVNVNLFDNSEIKKEYISFKYISC